MTLRPGAVALALAAVVALAPAARPQEEPPKPPAPATAPAPSPDDAAKRKEARVRRFLEVTRWSDSVMAGLDVAFDQQVRLGNLPREFPERFKEAADFASLEKIAIQAWGEVLDEATLDALIAFHETEAGRKAVEATLRITRDLPSKVEPWAMENAMRLLGQGIGEVDAEDDAGGGEEDDADDAEEGDAEEGGGPLEVLHRAKVSANETAAIATLRNLASCQAQIQTSGKIDCDRDGIGEHATFLELTGAAEVRVGLEEGTVDGKWAPSRGDFSKRGTKVSPPILSPKLAGVDAAGVVRKSGYCFRIYLPDSDPAAARFTHETGPAETVGLAGGTGRVGVDMSETTWCAYAWPERIGDTGRRAFFVNQAGDVMQSRNRSAKWEGEKAPPGNAAFLGDGVTSSVAVGTRGRDGEVWKVAN